MIQQGNNYTPYNLYSIANHASLTVEMCTAAIILEVENFHIKKVRFHR